MNNDSTQAEPISDSHPFREGSIELRGGLAESLFNETPRGSGRKRRREFNLQENKKTGEAFAVTGLNFEMHQRIAIGRDDQVSSRSREMGSMTFVFRSIAITVVRCSVPSRLQATTGNT